MTIEVIKPGALTTVQDLGRFGFQRFGVPVGGAMDEQAHRLANLLVGNAQGTAALEITMMGPSLRFTAPTLIAITGAELSPRIGEQALPRATPVLLRAGSQLDFGRRTAGLRAYLAVHGGVRGGAGDGQPVDLPARRLWRFRRARVAQGRCAAGRSG